MFNIINENFIQEYWLAIANQNRDKLRGFFDAKAIIIVKTLENIT